MKKWRILEYDNRYKIQRRFLLFFWTDEGAYKAMYGEPTYYITYYITYYAYLKEAQDALDLIIKRNKPIKWTVVEER